MDGLFYTKDEVVPYCSLKMRSFVFLFKILFDLHGRTSSYIVVCLNYLPLVFYILQNKSCFWNEYLFITKASICCGQQFQFEKFLIPMERDKWDILWAFLVLCLLSSMVTPALMAISKLTSLFNRIKFMCILYSSLPKPGWKGYLSTKLILVELWVVFWKGFIVFVR